MTKSKILEAFVRGGFQPPSRLVAQTPVIETVSHGEQQLSYTQSAETQLPYWFL